MGRLPVVSGKEAARAFEKAGFVFRRRVGSHMIYKAAGRGTLSVPDHKELDAGLLRHLIADAGMTPEEFHSLL
jgi:predicted RNA binding protein YcfA (HicA-like mRNA interferase family)